MVIFGNSYKRIYLAIVGIHYLLADMLTKHLPLVGSGLLSMG